LDEPASVLDAEGVERLSEEVAAHAAAGGIAVVAAHGAVALRGAREMTIRAPEDGAAEAT
ncbi:MAG: heme ABC transporter ATP-binding protein CcmA, partial [Alphaproteobacteria bacterium]